LEIEDFCFACLVEHDCDGGGAKGVQIPPATLVVAS
jgi:hypothetical protein